MLLKYLKCQHQENKGTNSTTIDSVQYELNFNEVAAYQLIPHHPCNVLLGYKNWVLDI